MATLMNSPASGPRGASRYSLNAISVCGLGTGAAAPLPLVLHFLLQQREDDAAQVAHVVALDVV